MTTAPAYEKGKLYQIPVTDLNPDPDQPRKVIDPEALAELVTSIEKFGIVQPLLFRDAGKGRHRRKGQDHGPGHPHD